MDRHVNLTQYRSVNLFVSMEKLRPSFKKLPMMAILDFGTFDVNLDRHYSD